MSQAVSCRSWFYQGRDCSDLCYSSWRSPRATLLSLLGKKQGPDLVGAGTPGCSVAFGLCCCLLPVRDWNRPGSAGSTSCSSACLQHHGVVATGTGVEGRGQRWLTELGGNHPVQAWVRSFSSERPRLHFLCFTK